jgi:hypothetical protein
VLDESPGRVLGSALAQDATQARKRGAQKVGSMRGMGLVAVLRHLGLLRRALAWREPGTYGGGRALEASVCPRVQVAWRYAGSGTLGGDGSYGGAAAKAVASSARCTLRRGLAALTFADNSGSRERNGAVTVCPTSRAIRGPAQGQQCGHGQDVFEDAARAIQGGCQAAVCCQCTGIHGERCEKGGLPDSGRRLERVRQNVRRRAWLEALPCCSC